MYILRTTRSRYLHLLFTPGLQPPRTVRFSTRIRIPSMTHPMDNNPRPANLHLSVDAEGKQVLDPIFASEALGMPVADGYGWAQFEFGDQFGEGDRYTIVRKLGWGMHSSTWLARDSVSVCRQLSCY